MSTIKLVITDDDPLVRLALAHFVARDPDFQVVAQCSDGREAISAVEKFHPDVVMMDIQMPGMDGIEATKVITQRWPDVCVVAVTTLDTADTVLPMLSAGASGYMLKESSADEIIAALHQAHEGTSALSPRVASMLVQHVRDSESDHVHHSHELPVLTDRESETLQYLATGMSNHEIAQAMHVSEATVKAHLGSIMQKWGVRDRVQVLVTAARAGLVSFQ
ncbi:MAG: response regulator transcription factor [Ancrocorticia sp.]|jgi:DNA-binding NarL/FixJ family response regulator|nr:response regulator transcription factor [Ancrocorticia sp.]MCI1895742.1 response regulator transcription factor [Ancrocorticia sp.]MCI1933347.1 response regulator transcription factor [Ancrocorticia sp.]MCI1962991.1 response regulator transcription factor [Ancrocorticia sp.]MCI2001359.1 response regulator transcription factor [Ancrocorticia sp.]